jgi:hypothetical protein
MQPEHRTLSRELASISATGAHKEGLNVHLRPGQRFHIWVPLRAGSTFTTPDDFLAAPTDGQRVGRCHYSPSFGGRFSLTCKTCAARFGASAWAAGFTGFGQV